VWVDEAQGRVGISRQSDRGELGSFKSREQFSESMSGRKALLSSVISSVKFMKHDLNGICSTARWDHGEADIKAFPGRAARSLAARP
jgi:hypothetical protein